MKYNYLIVLRACENRANVRFVASKGNTRAQGSGIHTLGSAPTWTNIKKNDLTRARTRDVLLSVVTSIQLDYGRDF
jgi:hypothetical protein